VLFYRKHCQQVKQRLMSEKPIHLPFNGRKYFFRIKMLLEEWKDVLGNSATVCTIGEILWIDTIFRSRQTLDFALYFAL
jgi:hypothetical protein